MQIYVDKCTVSLWWSCVLNQHGMTQRCSKVQWILSLSVNSWLCKFALLNSNQYTQRDILPYLQYVYWISPIQLYKEMSGWMRPNLFLQPDCFQCKQWEMTSWYCSFSLYFDWQYFKGPKISLLELTVIFQITRL